MNCNLNLILEAIGLKENSKYEELVKTEIRKEDKSERRRLQNKKSSKESRERQHKLRRNLEEEIQKNTTIWLNTINMAIKLAPEHFNPEIFGENNVNGFISKLEELKNEVQASNPSS